MNSCAPSLFQSFDSPTAQAEPPLIGIARLAAEAERADDRNEVTYNRIECRSALNRVNGTRAKFEWSINPYRGCEFGCTYCYARYTHEFMEHHDPMDFERKIYVKRSMASFLRRELANAKCGDNETIVIGAATDPYQPAEKRFGTTRSILETLADFSGLKIRIITKSDLILRDLDLLKEVSRRHRFRVNMTVTTTDARLARKTEPRAVAPRRRLEAVRQLNDAGIVTGIFLMPIMPKINDDRPSMEAVVRAAADSGAAFLAGQVLFLTPTTKRRYFSFLKEERPDLLPLYQRYYSKGINPPHDYIGRVNRLLTRLRTAYGLSPLAEPQHEEHAPNSAAQLELFASV